jgi:ribonuclease HI
MPKIPEECLKMNLYTDGGCISANPSLHGGTWAWCCVDETDRRIEFESGVVLPSDVSMKHITNNLTELLAAIKGLESMTDDWCGTLFTDSQITLRRVEKRILNPKMNGIPDSLVERLAIQKRRLGDYKVKLLGGHPTKSELKMGRRKDGAPCSSHNVFCDQLCCEQSRLFACLRS